LGDRAGFHQAELTGLDAFAEYLKRVLHLASRTGGQVPVHLIQLALASASL